MIKYGFYKHYNDVECIKYDISLIGERLRVPIIKFYHIEGDISVPAIPHFEQNSSYHITLITFDNFSELQKYTFLRIGILIKEEKYDYQT